MPKGKCDLLENDVIRRIILKDAEQKILKCERILLKRMEISHEHEMWHISVG